jgi:hypothetical protein
MYIQSIKISDKALKVRNIIARGKVRYERNPGLSKVLKMSRLSDYLDEEYRTAAIEYLEKRVKYKIINT